MIMWCNPPHFFLDISARFLIVSTKHRGTGGLRHLAVPIMRVTPYSPSGLPLLAKAVGHYFGTGVYFFEGARARAINWARVKFKTGEKVGIIQAIITLGSCLELTDPDNIDILLRLKKKLIKERRLTRVTNAYVINACANLYDVDTVRGAVYKGDWSSGFHNIELIICVRKTRFIGEISLVYEGEGVIR